PSRTVVRVNPRDSDHLGEDLRMLERTDYTTVMLPKAESASDLTVFGGLEVIALIETALGTINAAEIAAAPNVHGLMWGSEDLIADLGGGTSRRADGTWRDVVSHARSPTLLAARPHGKNAPEPSR
ncbi:CoA ester lyase, partial [Burkholderia multivorans]